MLPAVHLALDFGVRGPGLPVVKSTCYRTPPCGRKRSLPGQNHVSQSSCAETSSPILVLSSARSVVLSSPVDVGRYPADGVGDAAPQSGTHMPPPPYTVSPVSPRASSVRFQGSAATRYSSTRSRPMIRVTSAPLSPSLEDRDEVRYSIMPS